MTDVRVETTIARPREAVAAFASDPENDTRWIRALSEARLLTEPPVRVGSQVERVATFLGKRIEYVNEIVELEPGRRLAMRSVKGPFPMTVVYGWADAPGGTTMTIHAAGDAGGFYRLAGPLLSAAVRRGIAGDLKQLKRVLEES